MKEKIHRSVELGVSSNKINDHAVSTQNRNIDSEENGKHITILQSIEDEIFHRPSGVHCGDLQILTWSRKYMWEITVKQNKTKQIKNNSFRNVECVLYIGGYLIIYSTYN